MEYPQNVPKVGVGVLIFKEGKILLGKRRGSHGEGEYAPPGGHLEYMESFEDCARRETKEECGLEIKNIRFQFAANVFEYTPRHYVHIGLVADWKADEPELLAPEEVEGWDWYDLDKLPEPLFEIQKLAMEALRTGKNYFDA
ncbi:MAG: hypothetical protein G01um101430_619 [Parcubacteria group bacterium Gr01-1014_30]|nr:MAG: hypothetical protein G01um101430_619 [Parcubacteria group bacterium Gr01-1014_30]